MKCPCGCGKDVPHGCFWATKTCRKHVSAIGIYMPHRYERRKRILRNYEKKRLLRFAS